MDASGSTTRTFSTSAPWSEWAPRSRSLPRRKPATPDERIILMNRPSRTALKLLVAALAVLALPAAALAVGQSTAVSPTPPKAVVGAGTINVPTLLVRKSPDGRSPVIARLSEFRPQ